jgi:hypothetical protein
MWLTLTTGNGLTHTVIILRLLRVFGAVVTTVDLFLKHLDSENSLMDIFFTAKTNTVYIEMKDASHIMTGKIKKLFEKLS